MAAWRWLRLGQLGTEADRTTFRTLHTASLAAPALRSGLTHGSAERSIRHLSMLLGATSTVLTDTESVLAWDGGYEHHAEQAAKLAVDAVNRGATAVHHKRELPCDDPSCDVRAAIVCPLTVESTILGTLQVYARDSSAGLVRAAQEVAAWVSGQLELAELDASRTRLMEAEVRALRAQISPHFVYNSLTAIASFVRTDPERARELLLEFAEFTRYSFRRHGEFTTLAEELRSVERYLALEMARYGDRLEVKLRVAPEVLPVAVPFLCLQPLVENAVRHGLEGKSETGRIEIIAEDFDREAVISVEDDGVGEDPEKVRRALIGGSDSHGLGNVDGRMRSAYGDAYGLVVETAPGAGTKVIARFPKYAPGVHA
jgi:two-component system, LytTR family, sensor kinase